ncbi:MAG TPA: spore cortex biosynthesis protein YabQ [Ruminiclostridium sp.]
MISIVGQVYIFLYAILGGAIVAFLYDILRIKRRAIKTSIIIVSLEDIIYWLVAAVLLFITVYKINSGEMRGYIFIGNVIGVILYEELLSKVIIESSVMVINIIKKTLLFVWRILSYPFKLIFKILAVPIFFIFNLIFKLVKLFFKLAKMIFRKTKSISGKAGRFTKKRIRKIPNLVKSLRKVRKV